MQMGESYDIERTDRDLLNAEIRRCIPRFIISAIIIIAGLDLLFNIYYLGALVVAIGVWGVLRGVQMAKARAKAKRFKNPFFEERWNRCREQVDLFDKAMKMVKSTEVSALAEMPASVHKAAQDIYVTLRYADASASEIQTAEGTPAQRQERQSAPFQNGWQGTRDRQTQELLLAADKNRAEYRRRLEAAHAGIIRSDAQVEVFITAMDALRMNLVGFRLSAFKRDGDSHRILATFAEIRLQIESITTTLDELDFGLFPKTVAVDGSRLGTSPFKPMPDPDASARAAESEADEIFKGRVTSAPPPHPSERLGTTGANAAADELTPGGLFNEDEDGKIISLNPDMLRAFDAQSADGTGTPPTDANARKTPPPFYGDRGDS